MKTKQISFKATKADLAKIKIVARRACGLCREHNTPDLMDTIMDLTATHCNGCKLDLDKLLAADDFNLAHDVFGIARHIDRDTGQLRDCFVPRCAAR